MLPEMPPEPPPDFVAFVVRRLAAARAEAARLTGGERFADEVYPAAFADVAMWWHWPPRRRRADALLDRALQRNAKHWREEQIYPVEVVAVHTDRRAPVRFVSVAWRKAGLLPPTARPGEQPSAEAAIAWAYGYRRYRIRRVARTVLAWVVAVIAVLQSLPEPPA